MSHMGTSHVAQMGCGSFADVSALGTAARKKGPGLTTFAVGTGARLASSLEIQRGFRNHNAKISASFQSVHCGSAFT